MATPVGHSLVGLGLGPLRAPAHGRSALRAYLLAVFAANAPDLDFIPGLFVGDINRFHHTWSHSLGAALVFALLVGLSCRGQKWRNFPVKTIAFLSYVSHLAVDLLGHDARPPHGIPLLWPISSGYHKPAITLFGGIKHGVPGDSISVFMSQLFSGHNIRVLALELLVLLPVAVILRLLLAHGRRRGRTDAMEIGSTATPSGETTWPDR